MIRLLTIIGARPQIIKAAAISRAIRNSFSAQLKEIIVHTGQHYDQNMSAVFMEELQIPAEDYNLLSGSASHGKQTAFMMERIEGILLKEKPDAVIIYGDTNSTLAGAIAASKIHIPVIHIEAGLRSFNKAMPEEINRICCDHVSTLLFSPTMAAVKNLRREGFNINSHAPYTIDHPGVFHCGDIMYDNSLYFSEVAAAQSQILKRHDLSEGHFILATVHRESNTDHAAALSSVFAAFENIAEQDNIIVLPLHPRTRKMMQQFGITVKSSNIRLTEPASFLDMTLLESACRMVITDSGGVQKEAYFFKKPCIILREETEWVELVENGCAVTAGTATASITNAFHQFNAAVKMDFPPVFGDGKAAEFICNTIVNSKL
jgi:UDP-GlcNAc3NAcA epimerase